MSFRSPAQCLRRFRSFSSVRYVALPAHLGFPSSSLLRSVNISRGCCFRAFRGVSGSISKSFICFRSLALLFRVPHVCGRRFPAVLRLFPHGCGCSVLFGVALPRGRGIFGVRKRFCVRGFLRAISATLIYNNHVFARISRFFGSIPDSPRGAFRRFRRSGCASARLFPRGGFLGIVHNFPASVARVFRGRFCRLPLPSCLSRLIIRRFRYLQCLTLLHRLRKCPFIFGYKNTVVHANVKGVCRQPVFLLSG